MNNKLYIVATPIGNLTDMSQRAIDVLQSVDFIAAEDTRHSAKLLQHFSIATPMRAYHDHSSSESINAIIALLQTGKSVALIADAGTPLISDPGYRLVTLAREQNITVVPIPGASAVTAALSASGLPCDRFVFEGFLANKRGTRINQLEKLATETRTLIFYEAPHRIVQCLQDMMKVFGADRQGVIARELSKTFETIHGDRLAALIPWIEADSNQQRGEFVVLVHGAEKHQIGVESPEVQRVLQILLAACPLKQAAQLAAKITGVKKNLLYQSALLKLEE